MQTIAIQIWPLPAEIQSWYSNSRFFTTHHFSNFCHPHSTTPDWAPAAHQLVPCVHPAGLWKCNQISNWACIPRDSAISTKVTPPKHPLSEAIPSPVDLSRRIRQPFLRYFPSTNLPPSAIDRAYRYPDWACGLTEGVWTPTKLTIFSHTHKGSPCNKTRWIPAICCNNSHTHTYILQCCQNFQKITSCSIRALLSNFAFFDPTLELPHILSLSRPNSKMCWCSFGALPNTFVRRGGPAQ